MSKSLGNLVSVRDALARHTPDAFRLLFLNSHYSSPQTFSEEGFSAMERAAERLRTCLRHPTGDGEGNVVDVGSFRQRFIEAMDADLNTPQALAVLYDLAHETNRAAEAGNGVGPAQQTLRELGGVLGLTFEAPRHDEIRAVEPFITLLINTRTELRTAKQFALADKIRDDLAELGVALEDSAQGTQWRYRD